MNIVITSLLSGFLGALVIWGLQSITDNRKRKYERRVYILRGLLSNPIVSNGFVSAFNMILIEYPKKSKTIEWHNKFIENVGSRPSEIKSKADEETLQKLGKELNEIILVKLIEEIAKSIKIEIEQLDIANKVYFPRGFSDDANKQAILTGLLIDNQESLKTLYEKNAITIKIEDKK